MERLTSFMRYRTISRPARTGLRSASLAIACGAAVAVAAAGCGSTSSGGSNGQSGQGTQPISARQAITDAAQTSAKLNTASATVTILAGPETLKENLQLQLHPELKMSATLSGLPGTGNISEVIVGTTIYIKIAALAQSGKPWIKLSTSAAGSSSVIHQLLQQASSGNLATQAKLAQVMSGTHEAGHAVVDGVSTTRYDGTIVPSAVLPHLSAGLSKLLKPMLSQIHGPLHVSYWIDAQHQIRKVTEVETVSGQHVTTTIVYTAINQPVHITVPSAGQVRSTSLPGL
jgi:hypothetical protein